MLSPWKGWSYRREFSKQSYYPASHSASPRSPTLSLTHILTLTLNSGLLGTTGPWLLRTVSLPRTYLNPSLGSGLRVPGSSSEERMDLRTMTPPELSERKVQVHQDVFMSGIQLQKRIQSLSVSLSHNISQPLDPKPNHDPYPHMYPQLTLPRRSRRYWRFAPCHLQEPKPNPSHASGLKMIHHAGVRKELTGALPWCKIDEQEILMFIMTFPRDTCAYTRRSFCHYLSYRNQRVSISELWVCLSGQ